MDQREAERVTKDRTTFTTSFLSPETEMRIQFDDVKVNRAERRETFRQRGEQKDSDAEQAATPNS